MEYWNGNEKRDRSELKETLIVRKYLISVEMPKGLEDNKDYLDAQLKAGNYSYFGRNTIDFN